MHARPLAAWIALAALALTACGPAEPPAPKDPPNALVLALAQFVTEGGKSVPGPARLEFLTLEDGSWQTTSLDDSESNVFHKAMLHSTADGPALLTMAGSAAVVKSWRKSGSKLESTRLWREDFGGKFSRMRDAEVADLDGDGLDDIAVATHDQGVVAVLRATPSGDFAVEELDRKPNTFVHEIEIGDLDGDGVLEVYATPSEPNRLDGRPQSGQVVRYVPARNEGPTVVADLGDRHAKEILVADVDGDGRDELYVSIEGHVGGADGKQLLEPVEIRRYDADTPPGEGALIASLDDRLCRFLTAGDIDGDGQLELVAAAFSAGVWLLRPGSDPRAEWKKQQIDADSRGFEHAALLTDLDEDGIDELYVASDGHKEVRRYTWNGERLVRETIYRRPDDRPIFTWNLMPVPVSLVP